MNRPLAEQSVEIQSIDYRRLFPWLHLFRTFRIAIDVRKLLLAGVGVFLVSLIAPTGEASLEIRQLWNVSSDGYRVLSPLQAIIGPGSKLFQMGQEKSWADVAEAWTQLLWTLAVWAVFGGALSRMASVEFATDEKIPLKSALRFSGKRILSYLGAPFLPLLGIGFFWGSAALGGLVLGLIPVAGDLIAGLLWFLPLLFGFAMVVLLLVIALGWPLMFAAVSTEGSDAFDGLSRSYSALFNRPWHALGMFVLVILYGSLVIYLVSSVASLTTHLADWAVASGMGLDKVSILHGTTSASGIVPTIDSDTTVGAQFVGFWLYGVQLLVAGFVYSYFWTAVTIMYFLLRKLDDGTELDQVYRTAEEDEIDELQKLVEPESDATQDTAEDGGSAQNDAAEGTNASAADSPAN